MENLYKSLSDDALYDIYVDYICSKKLETDVRVSFHTAK